MDAAIVTCFRQDQGASHIAFDRVDFAVLAFVDIRPASHTRTIDDMRWLVLIQLLVDFWLVLHPHSANIDLLVILA